MNPFIMEELRRRVTAVALTYATFDPLAKGANISLSESNTRATSTLTAWESVLGTIFQTTGKHYAEFEIKYTSSGYMFGVGTPSANLALYPGATGGQSWGYEGASGYFYYNGSGRPGGVLAKNNGDIVMLAVDISAGKVWFGLNGVWMEAGNPATGVNPQHTGIIANVATMNTPRFTARNIIGNWGQKAFSHSPPSGFNQGWYS